MIPEDDEPMVVEDDVIDVRLGRPDSQREPELQIPTPHSTVTDQKLTRSPRPRSRLQPGTDMEIGVNDRRVRFREERDPPRHHLGVSSDRELMMEEPRGKIPRRAETSESFVPFHSSEASSSEMQQTSIAAASGNPSGD